MRIAIALMGLCSLVLSARDRQPAIVPVASEVLEAFKPAPPKFSEPACGKVLPMAKEGTAPAPGVQALQVGADHAVAGLAIPQEEYRCQGEADHRRVRLDGSDDLLVAKKYLYRRLIHGLPAYGPGTSVVVDVGSDGGVRSLVKDWATWERTPSRVRLEGLPAQGVVLDDALLSVVQGAQAKVEPPGAGTRLVAVGIRYLAQPSTGPGQQAIPFFLCSEERQAHGGAWNPTGLTFIQIGDEHLLPGVL